jgi:hypothetical protein
MQRSDARPMEKSLLEPCLRTPDTNEFEAAFAGYLDQQAALALVAPQRGAHASTACRAGGATACTLTSCLP